MSIFRPSRAAIQKALDEGEQRGRSKERAAIVHYLIETADWCDDQKQAGRAAQASVTRWLACRIALRDLRPPRDAA